MGQDAESADEFADKEIDKPSFLRRFGLRKDKPAADDNAADEPLNESPSGDQNLPTGQAGLPANDDDDDQTIVEPPAKDTKEYGEITEVVEPETTKRTEDKKDEEHMPAGKQEGEKKPKKSTQDSQSKN